MSSKMRSKNQGTEKIAKIKRCSVRLVRLNKQALSMASKAPHKLHRGRPAARGKVKTEKDLLKYTMPLIGAERSKRTPKPNRKYINDSTIVHPKVTQNSSVSESSDVESSDEYEIPSPPRQKKTAERLTPKIEPYKKNIARANLQNETKMTAVSEQKILRSATPQPNKFNVGLVSTNRVAVSKEMPMENKVVRMGSSQGFKLLKVEPKTIGTIKKKASPPAKVQKRKIDDDYDSDDDFSLPNNKKRVRKDSVTSVYSIEETSETSTIDEPPPAMKTRKSNSPQLIKTSALSAKLKEKLPDITTSKTPTPPVVKRLEIPMRPKTAEPIKYSTPEPPFKSAIIRPPQKMVDLEDFEQMPTFTIVNINDIINQKDEVVVIEKGKVKKSKLDKPDDDYKPDAESSEDDFEDDDIDSNHDSFVSKSKLSNRRKTQHTTILSDKIMKNAKPKSSHMLIKNRPTIPEPTKPYRNIIGGKNGKVRDDLSPTRPAPRILNSTLCKNVKDDVSPLVTKFMSKNNISDQTKRLHNNQNNNNQINRSKENVKTYPFTDNKIKPTITKPKQQVVATHLGNRRVRKITCFETWFVIKFPTVEPFVQKSWLHFTLMKLGNDIKQVELPSNDWSYKITLQRIGRNTNNSELYTGEVQDPTINAKEKHLYQPISIMFRRNSINNELRMQFDRAVIFKNRTFFINIDGKNVRLLGAPQYLQDFSEIETLLEIVDDISLVSPCVEQTNNMT